MDEGIKNKIEGLKDKADFFVDNNLRAFIKDKEDTFYFCDILSVGEVHLLIYNFAGKRTGEKTQLLWIDIESIDEQGIFERGKKAYGFFLEKEFDKAKNLLESKNRWVKEYVKEHFENINRISFSSLQTKISGVMGVLVVSSI